MQFFDNTKPGSTDIGKPVVYVLTHNNTIINVYREYIQAVNAAIEEVTIDPDNTYIDNFETVIYVDGCRGEMAILVEDLI